MSLANSRYARKTPLDALTQSKAEKLKGDKARATRLLKRLQWKAELLVVSYLRAIEILRTEVNQNDNVYNRADLRNVVIRATDSVGTPEPVIDT